MPDANDYADRVDRQTAAERELNANKAATRAAVGKLEEKIENPEFLDRLRDNDLDSDEYDFLEDLLGPDASGSHFIAQRSQQYEQQVKWLSPNRAERVIAEADPGRLCKGPRRQLAWRSNGRGDRNPRPPNTPDERRVTRAAYQANANLRSNAIEGAGRKSVTEATAVSKKEEQTEETSRSERVANWMR